MVEKNQWWKEQWWKEQWWKKQWWKEQWWKQLVVENTCPARLEGWLNS